MSEFKQNKNTLVNNIFLKSNQIQKEKNLVNLDNNDSSESKSENLSNSSDSNQSNDSIESKESNKVEVNKKYNEADLISFFSSKELCYYKTIDKFFKACPKEKIMKMLEIIEGQSEISLRVLDWFVTRYSKRKIDFDNGNGTMEVFDVHISYKSQLKSYKKRYFDPFRRRKKFYYHYDTNNKEVSILTTLGQLNFFRWAITNKIIDYVETNKTIVLKAMNGNFKEEKKKNKPKTKITSNIKKEVKDIINKEVKDIKEVKDNKETKDNLNEIKENKVIREIKETKKSKNINIRATKTIDNDELQLVLSFD